MNRGRAIAGGLRLISRALDRLAGEIEGNEPVFFANTPAVAKLPTEKARLSPALKPAAVAETRQRRYRQQFLDGDLLGEPAWEILLDLFIAYHEEREITVMSACLASGVPQTTALRWLNMLEEKGLIVRRAHRTDARARIVELSRDGVLAVGGALLGQERPADLGELVGLLEASER